MDEAQLPTQRLFILKSVTVQVFDTNLAVFYFHFQMWMTSQLPTSPNIDWESIEVFAIQEIILCLQSDELFKSSQQMRDQCHHACRVLYIRHALLHRFYDHERTWPRESCYVLALETISGQCDFSVSNKCLEILSHTE
jgi:uncharacterized membrane protein